MMNPRMRFGIFLAPFHKPGINPTLALEQDLELIQWLDRCGYDEAWCGEHHSAGSEISGSPEIFMAVASQRTQHIKLGSGVTSVSYHNPLWVAERIVQLDYLTRGRVMLGLGPGSLPSDGIMVGLSQAQTRPLLEDGLGVIMKLLTTEESVTFKNERWDLRDARLHLRPYSNPLFDIAIPAVASPTGPKLAGMHGVGLLSIGATTAAGFDALALHWDVMEAQAKHYKTQVDRNKWRLVGMVHVAETMDQAYRDVEYGMAQWFDYMQSVAAVLVPTCCWRITGPILMPPARATICWLAMYSHAGRATCLPKPQLTAPARHGLSWPRSTAKPWRPPPSATRLRRQPERSSRRLAADGITVANRDTVC
jgi:limonene 1,2-monooxygenase